MRFKETKKIIAKALVLTLIFSMLFTQNSYSSSDWNLNGTKSLDQLPNPVLEFQSVEVRNGYIYYDLNVPNCNLYPDELFELSPDLPAIDLNDSASRTRVDIMDGETGAYIYGFVGFYKAEHLNYIWFADSIYNKKIRKSVYRIE